MKSLFAYISLLSIKFIFLPNQTLLFWMLVAIGIDFITGFSKAVILKEARTSNGLRRTVTKFLQYGGGVAVGVVLNHAAHESNQPGIQDLLSWFNDGLVVFIIYIEVTSIFENLIACDNTSLIAKYFYVPAHKLLTWQITKNPITQAAEKIPDPQAPPKTA